MKHLSTFACLAFGVALLTLAPAAYAVDGIILIDQNRAMAGNITPGDTPGFPISITQPGSYRLAGNLTVPAATAGIEISASNVTIDLNGFSLVAPSRVNGDPLKFGIVSAVGTKSISIRNGMIVGFTGQVNLDNTAQVLAENLILNNGGGSIFTTSFFGGGGVIRQVTADPLFPNINSIAFRCPMVVVESVSGGGAFGADATLSTPTRCILTNNSGAVNFSF